MPHCPLPYGDQQDPPATREPAAVWKLVLQYFVFVRENARYLLVGFLFALVSSFGQTHFISAFAQMIRSSFGLSQGQWGELYAASTIASAIVMIWAGMLTDRFGVRLLGGAIMSMLVLACLAMAGAQGVTSLFLIIFVLRFLGQGMLGLISGVAMSRWFLATRGRALAITSLGFAFGQAVLPLIVVSLLPHLNWRNIWLGAAGVIALICLVIMLLLRQDRELKSDEATVDAVGMDDRHWTRKQALQHPLLWLMFPAMLGPPAWGTALFFHQVNLAESKGWKLVEFVGLFPMLTLTSIAVTFFNGWLIDKIGATRIMKFTMLPFAAAFFTIAYAETIAGARLGMFLFGISLGLANTLFGAFWAEIFGTRHLGTIKSLTTAAMVFGTALGPGVTSIAIDLGYPFPSQMYAMAIYFLLSSISTVLAVRLAKPTPETVL